jgi:hypothetical protein
MHSISKKSQALALRQKGMLYSDVAKELGIAKSTAFAWTHSLPLDAIEKERALTNLKAIQHKKIMRLAIINRQKRVDREKTIYEEAQRIVGNAPLSIDHKKLFCSILFWCEGGKDVRGGIQFINSDPVMIGKFLSLLREAFPLKEEKFRALVHLHDYHHQENQLKYWSKITQIPLSQFHKPYLKPHTGKNIREGYQGCISIRYLDSALGKLLKMIYSEFGQSL